MKNFILFLWLIAIINCSLLLPVKSQPYNTKKLVKRDSKAVSQVQKNAPAYLPPASALFSDSMDPPNDTTALKARGYLPYFRGSGPPGLSPPWFTGWLFPAFNGVDSSYVASDYACVVQNNEVDNWLVLPPLNISAGDTLSFFCRGDQGAVFPDTVEVMYSAPGDSVPEAPSWVLLGAFEADTNGVWLRYTFNAPASGSAARFAIRHHLVDGGPWGSNSWYIGIDQIDVIPLAVGISENSGKTEFNIYPNPAINGFFIQQPEDHDVYLLSITNLMGQVVHSDQAIGLRHYVDVSGWGRGVYFVNVVSKSHSVAKRIILK